MTAAAILIGIALASGETDAVAWVEREGGRVTRDAQSRVVGIDLTATWILDSGLARLASFPGLTHLNLSHTRVTDAGLAHLRPLKNLRRLNLYYAEFFTDDGLASLATLENLEELVLRGTKVTSRGIEQIAKLRNLRSLDLGYTQIDDTNIDLLSNLERLESLSLGGNRIGPAGIGALRTATALRHLDLGGVQRVDSGEWGVALSEQAMEEIGRLAQLRSLSLAGATLADTGTDRPGLAASVRPRVEHLDKLSGLTRLERLNLSRLPLDRQAFESLKALPRLEVLDLGQATGIGDESVAAILALRPRRVLTDGLTIGLENSAPVGAGRSPNR